MIIDSGAHVNTVTEKFWCENKSSKEIFNVKLNAMLNATGYASRKRLVVIAKFTARVHIESKPESCEEFYVIKDAKKGLLGRFASKRMKVLMVGLEVPHDIARIEIGEFPKIPNLQVKFDIDPSVQPVQAAYFKVPYAIENLVEQRFEKYDKMKITEDVEGHSAWISGILAATKGKNDIRLCLNMKNPNKAIRRENYPLPTIDDFTARLNGAKLFSAIDLSDAYFHVELHPDSREITTFMTKRGLKRFTRLMFGVNSAPEQFQRIMDTLFKSCEGVKSFIDDILVWGSSEEEHDNRLKSVLEVCKENNLTLNETKSVYKQKEVKFLGHIIDENGMRPAIDKLESVKNFILPSTPSELRGFLGLVNFVGRYVPNMATNTETLRAMLRENSMTWTEVRKKAFENLKQTLLKAESLAFYDVKAKSILYTDASPTGLGAILVQVHDGVEKVVAYASKSLTPTERRYPQTQREALGAVWGIERFYYYLYGTKFALRVDYSALKFIWQKDISNSKRAISRAESYALRLMPYDFEIVHVKGDDNIADCLSRIVEIDENAEPFDEDHPVFLNRIEIDDQYISREELVDATKVDVEIQMVINAVQTGDWKDVDVVYRALKKEFEVESELLFKDFQVVVPTSLRERFLKMAHSTHAGIVSMKRIVRERAWWPRLNIDVEKMVRECHACQLLGPKNRPIPLVMSEIPSKPMEGVAIDFLEIEKGSKELLMVTCLHSKFLMCKAMSSTTTDLMIEKLEEIFCEFSYPKWIKQDNGSQFISELYKNYCLSKGIKNVHSPPLNPESNGEIENRNKGILKAVRAGIIEGKSWKECVRNQVRNFNTTPNDLTLATPFSLMFNRAANVRLEMIRENPWTNEDAIERAKVERRKTQESENAKRRVKEPELKVGDKVIMLRTTYQNKLLPKFIDRIFEIVKIERNEAVIQEIDSPVTYRRAINHLKKYHEPSTILAETAHDNDTSILPANSDDLDNSPVQSSEQLKSNKRSNNDGIVDLQTRQSARAKKKTPRLIETCNIEN